MSRIIFFLLVLLAASGCSRNISVIPLPLTMKEGKSGQFRLSDKTIVDYDGALAGSAEYFQEYISAKYSIVPKIVLSGEAERQRRLIRLQLNNEYKEGQYRLEVTRKSVEIEGSASGIFYGIQSLIQLLPVRVKTGQKALKVPPVVITDEPRFAYRGMLLDVSRHFFTVDFVKKCINLAALHKMNYLQLHLTDDQGWRVEIKKYPQLNETGSWRNGTSVGQWPGTGNDSIRHGGYYTRSEISDLVDYANERYITIIPEIEMPGHALAALASYPWLGCTGGPYQVKETWGAGDDVFCAGKDTVFSFLEDVLDEVMEMFPSEFIHIGGDECPKERWKNCPLCQGRMKANGLSNEDELQSYFVTRIEKFISSKGRRMIGWDEILDGGLAPNAVVMSWRGNGESGCMGAVKEKHQVIMTPAFGFYLDYPQNSEEDSLAANWGGVTTVRASYDYNPVIPGLKEEEIRYVIGGQANIWTEFIGNPDKLEYMMLPRLSAVSEVLWSPQDKRSWEGFKIRMEKQYQRYKLWNVKFNPADIEMK